MYFLYLIIHNFICWIQMNVPQFAANPISRFTVGVLSKMAPQQITILMIVKMMFHGCSHCLEEFFLGFLTILFYCVIKIADETLAVHLFLSLSISFPIYTDELHKPNANVIDQQGMLLLHVFLQASILYT